MKTYFEISEDNEVLKVVEEYDQPNEDDYFPVIKTFVGYYKQVVCESREHESVYYNGIFDLTTGEYNRDPDNLDPIEIDGTLHELDENGEVVIPILPGLPSITNECILHSNTHILAMLDVLTAAGTLPERDIIRIQPDAEELTPALPYEFKEITREDEGQPVYKSVYDGQLHSPRYDQWHGLYFSNHATVYHLEMLVSGGVITQDEADAIVAERLAVKGV